MNLFKLFQNLSNRFQGIEIHEVHLLAIGGDEGADFGVALRFGDFRDLRIQKLHHDSVFQTEFGVIDGAAKVEHFTFVVMRCRNLLFEAAPDVVDVFGIGRVGETDGRDKQFLTCREAANRFLEAHDTAGAEGAQIDDAVIAGNAFHVFKENCLLRLYHTTSYPASDKTFSAFSKFSAFTRI